MFYVFSVSAATAPAYVATTTATVSSLLLAFYTFFTYTALLVVFLSTFHLLRFNATRRSSCLLMKRCEVLEVNEYP